MILDLNRYRRALDGIKPQLVREIRTPEWRITEASSAHHIPLLAVALYALRPDILGENAAVRHVADRALKFNRYTEVKTWIDGPKDPDKP